MSKITHVEWNQRKVEITFDDKQVISKYKCKLTAEERDMIVEYYLNTR